MIFIDKNKTIELKDKSFWGKEAMFWSSYGKIYHHLEVSTPYKKMLALIASIVKLRECNRWLDAGCGPGTMIELLLKNQHQPEEIIGIDFDGVMIDKASKRLSLYNNVKIEQIDLARKTFFKNNYFDGILANLVLSYIIIYENQFVGKDALREVLKEMYRILKDNGLFIWTTPIEKVNFTYVFLDSWREVLNPLTPQYLLYGPWILSYAWKIQAKGKKGIYHFLPKSKIEELMEEIGFKNIHIQKTFSNQAYLITAIK